MRPTPRIRGSGPVTRTVVAAGWHAQALGWPGVVLPEVRVFGCLLQAVVVLDADVHSARLRDGDGPELDGDTLSMWEWPESSGPTPALRLSGALFPCRRGWRHAFGNARQWRAFGPAALLAPSGVVDEVCRWECALQGVGLAPLEGGPAAAGRLIPAESGRRAPARRRTADRWVEEYLYGLAIRAGMYGSRVEGAGS